MSKITQLFIQRKGGRQQIVQGEMSFSPEDNPESVAAQLKKAADPNLDYFVFAPLRGEGSYLFKTSAGNFSSSGKTLEEFQFRVPFHQNIGRIEQLIDHSGNYTVADVRIHIERPPDTHGDLHHETFLQDCLARFLTETFRGKTPQQADFQKALLKLAYTVNSLTAGFRIHYEMTGKDKYILNVQVIPAPVALDISDLPLALQYEAKTFLDNKMREFMEEHPFIKGFYLVDVDENEPKPYDKSPKASSLSSELAWRYPNIIPPYKDSIFRDVMALVSDTPPAELIPPVLGNQPMPIPQSVMRAFELWLGEKFLKEKGEHQLLTLPEKQAGHYRLAVKKTPFDIRLSEQYVAAMQATFGIDLAEEAERLKQGTHDWSLAQVKAFMKKMSAKYKNAGYELLIDHPKLFISFQGSNTKWIQPQALLPLTTPQNVDLFFPDEDVKRTPTQAEVRTILFRENESLDQETFRRRFYEVQAAFEKNDFLLATAVPHMEQSAFPITPKENPNRLIFPLARYGRLRLETGDIPQASLEALQKELEWREGEPVHPKAFEKKLYRILARLHLIVKGKPVYAYRNIKTLDAYIVVDRPVGGKKAGLQYDPISRNVLGSASATTFHLIPQTSQAGANIALGQNHQSLGINAETLPFTKGGTRMEVGAEGSLTHSDIAERDYQNAVAYTTLIVPLGEGIASPVHLLLPLRFRYVRAAGGTEAAKEHLFGGSGAGISYADGALLGDDDFLSVTLRQDVDNDFNGKGLDTTSRLKARYANPLSLWELEFQLRGDFMHRQSLNGTALDEIRITEGSEGVLDFTQGMQRYPSDSGATLSALIRKPIGPLALFAGASLSQIHEYDFFASGEREGHWTQRGGIGFGIDIPFIGAEIYFGWPVLENGTFHSPQGNPKFGMSMRWSTGQ